MQIFVTGMHRSGTSLVTRLINLMGAYFGPEGIQVDPLEKNPKGFWERKDVRALNDRILKAHGCDWDRVDTWEEGGPDKEERAEIESEARRTLFRLEGFRPWVVKEPRLSLTLPYFLSVCEAPVAVLVVRNPGEVATSLKTRNGMATEDAYTLWEAYNRSMLECTAGLPRIVVEHAAFLADPVGATHRLYAMLRQAGCRRLTMPSDREIRAFVSSGLSRSRASETEPPAAVRARFDALRVLASYGVQNNEDSAEVRPRFQAFLEEFRTQVAAVSTTFESTAASDSEDERIRLERRLSRLEAENERLLRALLDIQEHAERQAAQELALRSERDDLVRQSEDIALQLRTIAQQLAQRERQVRALRRSLSWKVTKPARVMLGAFRGHDK